MDTNRDGDGDGGGDENRNLAFETFTHAASTADLSEEPAARGRAGCFEFGMELSSILAGDVEGLLEVARERGVAVVASTHDFEGTPPRTELVRTLTEAGKYADVAKLAVTAETNADALALLSATEQLTAHGESVATMVMGKVGTPELWRQCTARRSGTRRSTPSRRPRRASTTSRRFHGWSRRSSRWIDATLVAVSGIEHRVSEMDPGIAP